MEKTVIVYVDKSILANLLRGSYNSSIFVIAKIYTIKFRWKWLGFAPRLLWEIGFAFGWYGVGPTGNFNPVPTVGFFEDIFPITGIVVKP
jgi:hypothetical protein